MIFADFTHAEGCRSYLVGCEESCAAAIIDPTLELVDRYSGEIRSRGLRLRYIIDTHTHADHFTGAPAMRAEFGAPIVMHRHAAAPFVDIRVEDGHSLPLGDLRLAIIHTPGHTSDSMCVQVCDRVFTGDTLLIGGTGRSDLPSGNSDQLYDSLNERLLALPDETLVYPAHDYKGRDHSTIGQERETNPRLAKSDRAQFREMMDNLHLNAPTHLTEALRTNMSGGKTVSQLLREAAERIPFMSIEQLSRSSGARRNDFVVLDVRERAAYEAGHVPGAVHLPRGQLELSVDELFPDPDVEIVAVCELGRISTLAAATLKELGFGRATALDGGMRNWRDGGFPVEQATGV